MSKYYNIIAPCHFGLEAVLKKEIIDLGYEIVSVDDGRVTFAGDSDAIVRANIFLRTAERVLLEAGSFKAESFEELFEGVRKIEWEQFIPSNARFWVAKASSVRSKLFSPSDIQSIVKKAMVRRLGEHYGISWFPEDGAAYPLRVFIKKDIVTVCLDTTGDSLHKRGYRKQASKAPIAENLAAALLILSGWDKSQSLVDPFCGSGTFPIEAAMMAVNMAPGMNREFTAESWTNIIDKKIWYNAIDEAEDILDLDAKCDISGFDIESDMIRSSIENAKLAGVNEKIYFRQRAVKDLSHPGKNGIIITNPPYGERLLEKELLPQLYGELGSAFNALDDWGAYIITSYDMVEKYMGCKAAKNRKIYNGMLKTYFYQYPVSAEGKRSIVRVEKPENKEGREKKYNERSQHKSIRKNEKDTAGREIKRQETKDNDKKRAPRKWTMN